MALRCGDTVKKLRVEIRSNSYDFQCHARIAVWRDDQWSQLHYIHHGQMATASSLAYKPLQPGPEAFQKDRDQLVKMAAAILN